jgi:hypothetical protein
VLPRCRADEIGERPEPEREETPAAPPGRRRGRPGAGGVPVLEAEELRHLLAVLDPEGEGKERQ